MLYRMSHPWHIVFIGEVAHVDVNGRTGLIGVGIMN
jgi:hypothetical protein